MNMKNMKTNYNTVIELFNVALPSTSMVEFNKMNEFAMKLGYLVHPDACTTEVLNYLKSKNLDYNSTFYKEWTDVTSRTRFELLIDQLIHYATTYGTDFALDNGYVPNDAVEGDAPYFTYDKLTVIMPATYEEVYIRCMDMLTSGIALKGDTVNFLTDYVYTYAITEWGAKAKYNVDIDSIKNREARIILYDKLGASPNDKFELIKYIVYKATGSAMIIKNRSQLQTIKANSGAFDFRTLTTRQLEGLASIFYRYKDTILMFKNGMNATTINKLRRMAVTLHKPMKVGFWESLTTGTHTFDEIYEKSAELTNYKIVTLLQMLREQTELINNNVDTYKKMIVVRNGKVFYKDSTVNVTNVDSLTSTYRALLLRLATNLSSKAGYVRIPDYLNLACPTSEKNFIGNIPFGSYFDMTENNIIGIYWQNDWGTRDFDLSMNDVNGGRIGWNSRYYDRMGNDASIVYSGDMTNASPCATELLYAKNTCPSGSIYVNRFNGAEVSKFRFFYANECLNGQDMYNHMCDKSKIKVDVMMESIDRQSTVGFVADSRFFFMDMQSGNTRVAHSTKTSQADIFNIFARKANSSIYVKDILELAGFNILGENDATPVNEDGTAVEVLDLTQLSKDTLIKLFDK